MSGGNRGAGCVGMTVSVSLVLLPETDRLADKRCLNSGLGCPDTSRLTRLTSSSQIFASSDFQVFPSAGPVFKTFQFAKLDSINPVYLWKARSPTVYIRHTDR